MWFSNARLAISRLLKFFVRRRCCCGSVDLEALALVIILLEGVEVGVVRAIVIAFCARVRFRALAR